MFCTQCGKRNPESAQFCFSCGTPISGAAESVAAPGAATSHPPQPESPVLVSAPQERPTVPTLPPMEAAGNSGNSAVRVPGGFWIRLAATVIDLFVIGAAAVVVGGVFAGFAVAIGGGAPEGFIVGYYLANLTSSFLYYAVLESSARQATLGKRALGLQVTDIHGQQLSFGRATGRAFAKWLNALTLGVGWLMAAFTAQKRGLHDYVAGTIVVRRPDARRSSAWIIALVVCVFAVPVVGIVAAIAVPGLLRARMSGNEASAIGSLRLIQSAQTNYFQTCNGYATDLEELAKITGVSLGTVDGGSVTKSGYTFSLLPLQGAALVSGGPECSGPVSDYFAQASPVTTGSTGVRHFATKASGVIYSDTAATFANATPLE